MTLVAAFRCRDNGMLLCADREEDDGYARRPIDKIHRLSGLRECEVFIAGSGITVTVEDAYVEIDNALRKAESSGSGVTLLTEHRRIMEESLKGTHERYKEYLRRWPLHLLIIVAPRLPGAPPIFYRTDRYRLVPTALHAAFGSGKTIADYLIDRLYVHGIPNNLLLTLATFIFREAEKSSSGVGLGNDMVLIYIGGSKLEFFHTDSIKELDAGIPGLQEALWSHWQTHLKPPDWLKRYAADADSST